VSLTIDITALPEDRLSFTPSPLAELVAMLHLLAEPGHHPTLHGWATATAGMLKPELADRLIEADFLWRYSRADFLLPARPAATLAEELDAVDRLDDERYVAVALLTSCGSARLSYRPAASPLIDQRARDRARELAAARGPRQAAFTERLLADPAAVRALVRRLLEDCDQAFFADAWRQLVPGLAADARHKADLLARHGLAEALAAVSSAVTLEEDGSGRRRIVVDKLQDNTVRAGESGGATFIPTVFGRPHLVVVHARGWQPVLQYPVAEAGLAEPVSFTLVQQRLEALAHPVRLRLARTLARGPHSTGELAVAWNLSAPEVSRHLAVLRKAGLLTTRRRGRYVLYSLDLANSARLGADLVEAVLR
jgi:DNA-binding transcriptional ArsR family regulator